MCHRPQDSLLSSARHSVESAVSAATRTTWISVIDAAPIEIPPSDVLGLRDLFQGNGLWEAKGHGFPLLLLRYWGLVDGDYQLGSPPWPGCSNHHLK